jgi:hypothetical protein
VGFLEIPFDFQMALYVHGVNELRWGESGSGRAPATKASIAPAGGGVYDEAAKQAIPASEFPFDSEGITSSNEWPLNQCRAFLPLGGG